MRIRGRQLARLAPSLVLALALVTVLPACAPRASAPEPTPAAASPSTGATTSPTTSSSTPPSGSASPTPRSERPVLAVPDVSPEGFTAAPAGSGLARYTAQLLDWKACGDKGLECAQTKAPLDYDQPDGQAITLALSRKKATQAPRLGSLFINPGGPGGSGVDYVSGFDSTGLEQYDIVGWDPRGVGKSTPVVCENGSAVQDYLNVDNSPDSQAETDELIDAETALGRSCLEKSGPLLAHISTEDTVRDLHLLRGLVGDEKLSYFGSSYGTAIGALYAQLFGPEINKMVLDGAVNITDDDSVSQALGFQRALEAFADWCARQNCRLGSSRAVVVKSVTDLWDRLDSTPLAAGSRKLTQSQGVTGVTYMLYQPESAYKYLEQALELAIDDTDGRYLLFLADQYNERQDSGQYGQATFAFPAIRCLDDDGVSVTQAEKDWAKVKKEAPIFGAYSGLDLTCARWPVNPVGQPPTITGPGAPPIVVIGTTGDPATPYEYAQSMARQLQSGVLLTFEGEGHLAYGDSRCIQGLVHAYLVDGHVPDDGQRCS